MLASIIGIFSTSRSNTPVPHGYSPISIIETLDKSYNILTRGTPNYHLTSHGDLVEIREDEIQWFIQRNDNISIIPDGLYDFVILQKNDTQEIRVVNTETKNDYQHHTMVEPVEKVIYAGRMAFENLGTLMSWTNEYSIDLNINCISEKDTELPLSLAVGLTTINRP